MKQYEERKAEATKTATDDDRSPRRHRSKDADDAPQPTNRRLAADGMMAGVTPGVKTAEDEKKKMLPVTTFGRYMKMLLSSNEFLFVS